MKTNRPTRAEKMEHLTVGQKFRVKSPYFDTLTPTAIYTIVGKTPHGYMVNSSEGFMMVVLTDWLIRAEVVFLKG